MNFYSDDSRAKDVSNLIRKFELHCMSNSKWVKFIDNLKAAMEEKGFYGELEGNLKLVGDDLIIWFGMSVHDRYGEDYFAKSMNCSLVNAYICRNYFYREIEWLELIGNEEIVNKAISLTGVLEYERGNSTIKVYGYK